MKPIFKYLLLSGALLGAWYIPTILASKNLKFSISGFAIDSIKENNINAIVRLKATNPTGVNLSMTELTGNLFLNRVQVGSFNELTKVSIPAKGEHNIDIAFTVDVSVIGKMLWTELINSNLQNSNLMIDGSVVVNSKRLPFDSSYTIKDITK